VFAELAYQNPLVARYERTGDGRAYRFSDVVSQEEFHALEIYDRLYRIMGQEYQIAFTLPNSRERILGIALGRKRRDFTDAERDLLNAARPFLIQAYQNSIRYSDLLARHSTEHPVPEIRPLESLVGLGLTDRQAQILQMLATGAADRDIAARLGLSTRTVQKHLQHCYRALGVGSRSEAAAVAWSPE
jgi:DNA-binding CsgD family transcriptional regulator